MTTLFEDVREDRLLTCQACPTQYQGRLPDGRIYYFRYRSGRATLGLAETFEDAVIDAMDRLDGGEYLAIGGRLDGSLSEEEFERAAAQLLREREDA